MLEYSRSAQEGISRSLSPIEEGVEVFTAPLASAAAMDGWHIVAIDIPRTV